MVAGGDLFTSNDPMDWRALSEDEIIRRKGRADLVHRDRLRGRLRWRQGRGFRLRRLRD